MSNISKKFDNQLVSMNDKKISQSIVINEKVAIGCGKSTTVELKYLPLTCAMGKNTTIN